MKITLYAALIHIQSRAYKAQCWHTSRSGLFTKGISDQDQRGTCHCRGFGGAKWVWKKQTLQTRTLEETSPFRRTDTLLSPPGA